VWRTQLGDLLEQNPAAAPELRSLVAEVQAQVAGFGRVGGAACGRVRSGAAGGPGHGVQNVTFGGQGGPGAR
jgi:hypothetical protein